MKITLADACVKILIVMGTVTAIIFLMWINILFYTDIVSKCS